MKEATSSRIRFGAFELDLKAGELHKGGRKVRLQEQPFQVLQMLVERGGEVVSREEIQSKLWPNDTVVEFDHGINTAIRKLRNALNDSAEIPKYIETVARRGYRLIMPVELPQSSSDGGAATGLAAASDGAAAVKPQFQSGTLTPGKTVSHYRVLNIIGGGGMGVVYRAEDLRLGRQVALKFLPEEVGSDPVALGRFEREARTASSLNHPNICTIYEIEEHQGRPFIVMEYMEGMTLRELIGNANIGSPLDKSHKPQTLRVEEVIDIAMQIAEGLEAAHQKGIIHRDIKPANIFITGQRQVKILDFGLAKLMTEAKDATGRVPREDVQQAEQLISAAQLEGNPDSNLTREGASIGTAGYMSPEQVEGIKLDARTDLFCFGLVIYELTTGRRAFGGGTKDSLREAVLHQSPVGVRELNPAAPPKLEEIITRCLQKDRNLRYQHASDLRKDLKQIRREMSSLALSRKEIEARIAEASNKAPLPVRAEPEKQPPTRWLRRVSFAAVVVVLAAAAGIWYARSNRAPALTGKDTIVIADFTNSTGNPVFDDTLKTALSLQLEQSPFINVLSDHAAASALKLMDRPANQRVVGEIARELCLRTNSKAAVEGSIAAVGEHYVIGLKATNCQTGNTLASAEAEAENLNRVLPALENAGNQLRARLGESLASLGKFNQPLEEATTSSLEALQSYTQGRKIQVQGGGSAAIPYFQRAVELDPNFALAYLALGTAYHNVNETSLSSQNLKKAYELRNRASHRERLAIEAQLYLLVTGELEKAIQTDTEMVQSYPGDFYPHVNLGYFYTLTGQYEKAAAEVQESLRLASRESDYANLIGVYVALNRLDQAQAVLNQVRAPEQGGPYLHQYWYYLGFLKGDEAIMRQQLAWGLGKPGVEDMVLTLQSDTEAYHGRFTAARNFSQRAVDSARRAGAAETAGGWKATEALREAEIGNFAQARQQAGEALALSDGRAVRILAALALARAGEAAQAQKLADRLDHEAPLDSIVQSYWLPSIRAAMAIDKRSPQQALTALEAASTLELGTQPPFGLGPLYPVYLRGVALLQSAQAPAAAAEFKKMLDHPGIAANFVLAALAHLQLGRAQAMMGDKNAARKSYEDFLGLWKEADSGLLILQQAKREQLATSN